MRAAVTCRRLINGMVAPGLYAVAWDGRDTRGAEVGAGVYLAQLWVDGRVETQKMVRVFCAPGVAAYRAARGPA